MSDIISTGVESGGMGLGKGGGEGFLLERVVHQVLTDEREGARGLLSHAIAEGQGGMALLAEVLWPAAECVHQLRRDGMIATRLFNTAMRALAQRTAQVGMTIPAAPAAAVRPLKLFVMAAPGEPTDLGAQILAMLGEAHGLCVQFAGAELTQEEVLFALTRLEPDAVVMVGSGAASVEETGAMMEAIRRARIWPEVQMAVAGAMTKLAGADGLGADIAAASAVEVLELISLCPEARREGGEGAMQLMAGATAEVTLHPSVLRDFLCQRFPPRVGWN